LRTVVLAALLTLLVPAAASAAPFAIGEGHSPGVAVDPAGTAYIAWYGPEAINTTLRFCRLSRGAQTCAGQALIATGGGDSLYRPFVSVSGPRVLIAQFRYGYSTGAFNRVVLATSTDGGDTFNTAASIGPPAPEAFDEAITGPGDTISTVTFATTGGGFFQNLAIPGPTTAGPANLFADRPYNGALGLLNAATPLAVFANASSDAAFRAYDGSGSLNDQANWTAAVGIGYADYPHLAGGPAGLFLLHGTETNGLVVRRWDGTTFPAGVPIAAGADDANAHLFQDAAGRLHAVWSSIDASGFRLLHAVSDDGVTWSAGSLALQSDDIEADPRVATAPDHVGVAVWTSRAAGTTQIRASALGPGAPAPPPVPVGPPVGVPPPAADPVPQFHKTVVVKPISGKVRVRLKGGKTFTDLGAIDDIPLGATIDVKKGRIELTSLPSRTGAAERIQLYGGWFRVGQPAAITEFTLNEPLAACKKARAAAAKPKSRKLWGDGKGKFRTRGQYSAATIRGTRFLVQDSCSGTLTRVAEGSVLVRDNVKRKNIVLRKGKRYTARPRR
jgi:hypothetical protein